MLAVGRQVKAAMEKTFEVTIVRDGSACFIPVPFDPRAVFGKVRAPVRVTLNGYSYRSTIASMGEGPFIPLRRSNREAAGLEGNETLAVTLELDQEKREVALPADLKRALRAPPSAWEGWNELSFTHKREHVEGIEGAKQPETRARRIERAVQFALARRRAARGGQAASEAQPARRTLAKVASAVKAERCALAKGERVPAAKRRLNAAWHAQHSMPPKATLAQRLAWHREHEKRCGCRPMPARLRALVGEKRR